jgi:hypothetical protein
VFFRARSEDGAVVVEDYRSRSACSDIDAEDWNRASYLSKLATQDFARCSFMLRTLWRGTKCTQKLGEQTSQTGSVNVHGGHLRLAAGACQRGLSAPRLAA